MDKKELYLDSYHVNEFSPNSRLYLHQLEEGWYSFTDLEFLIGSGTNPTMCAIKVVWDDVRGRTYLVYRDHDMVSSLHVEDYEDDLVGDTISDLLYHVFRLSPADFKWQLEDLLKFDDISNEARKLVIEWLGNITDYDNGEE